MIMLDGKEASGGISKIYDAAQMQLQGPCRPHVATPQDHPDYPPAKDLGREGAADNQKMRGRRPLQTQADCWSAIES